MVRMKRPTTLVCDIGSNSIKLGFAGNLTPHTIVPCRVWCPVSKCNSKESFLPVVDSNEQSDKHQKIEYKYPLSEGRVSDWAYLEEILRAALRILLKRDGDDSDDQTYSRCKILLTKPYGMKKVDIESLVEIFLFKFGFYAVTMHEQAALVLYTQGVETGVVVDMGESSTTIVPVYKGHAIPKLDRSLPIGGGSVASYLLKLLRLQGFPFHEIKDLEIGRQLKECVCYVALQIETEERLAMETNVLTEHFKLPDGTVVSIGRERFGAVEALFDPGLCNIESNGLSELIFEVIHNADIDCRADLYRNVILSGGTSLLPGIQERLEKDINERYVKKVLTGDRSRSVGWNPQVHAPSSRHHLVFEGAALFADYVAEDSRHWVRKDDFSRFGIQAVLDKCTI